jgi:hypothetical protein
MVATVQELGIAVVAHRVVNTASGRREQSAIPGSSSPPARVWTCNSSND